MKLHSLLLIFTNAILLVKSQENQASSNTNLKSIRDSNSEDAAGGNQGSNQRPAVQLRLTKNGLNYWAKTAQDLIKKSLVGQTFDPITINSNQANVQLDGITVTEFSGAQLNVANLPPNTLELSSTKAHIVSNGNWHGNAFGFSVGGTMSSTADDVSLVVRIMLGRDNLSQPRLTVTQCTCVIGQLDIDVKSPDALVQSMAGQYEPQMVQSTKPIIEEKTCDKVKSFIANSTSLALIMMASYLNIDDKYSIDYRLVSDPTVADDYVVCKHNGQITYKNQSGGLPFFPPNLDTSMSDPNSKMIHIWASDYVFNSGSFRMHNHGEFEYTADNTGQTSGYNQLRLTDCNNACIGKIFPEIKKKFPDANSAQMTIKSDQAPIMIVQDNGINLQTQSMMDIKVKSGPTVLQAIVMCKGKGNAKLQQNQLMTNFIISNCKITEVVQKAQWVKVNSDRLQTLERSLPSIMEQVVNNDKHFKNGIKLPMSNGIQLLNSDIKYGKRTIEFISDFGPIQIY